MKIQRNHGEIKHFDKNLQRSFYEFLSPFDQFIFNLFV